MLTPPSNEAFLALTTPQQQLDAVVAHLTEGPLDDGGYPYDYEWFGSTLVVAELDDDGATKIGIYKRRDSDALAPPRRTLPARPRGRGLHHRERLPRNPVEGPHGRAARGRPAMASRREGVRQGQEGDDATAQGRGGHATAAARAAAAGAAGAASAGAAAAVTVGKSSRRAHPQRARRADRHHPTRQASGKWSATATNPPIGHCPTNIEVYSFRPPVNLRGDCPPAASHIRLRSEGLSLGPMRLGTIAALVLDP